MDTVIVTTICIYFCKAKTLILIAEWKRQLYATRGRITNMGQAEKMQTHLQSYFQNQHPYAWICDAKIEVQVQVGSSVKVGKVVLSLKDRRITSLQEGYTLGENLTSLVIITYIAVCETPLVKE